MDKQLRPDQTRRPGVEASPVRLGDGNLWGLALPTPRLRPQVDRGVDPLGRPIETIRVVTEVGYPLEIRRLIDELRDACERGPAETQHQALFRLAVSLIRRVHDLEVEEVTGLLEMDLGDLPGFVEAVLTVLTGESLENTDPSRKQGADA